VSEDKIVASEHKEGYLNQNTCFWN